MTVKSSIPRRKFDGVIEVVVPVVFGHIAERGANAALGCHGVRAGWKYFGENGHVQAGACQLQGSAHAGATGPHDNDVKFTLWNFGRESHDFLRSATKLERPNRNMPRAKQS